MERSVLTAPGVLVNRSTHWTIPPLVESIYAPSTYKPFIVGLPVVVFRVFFSVFFSFSCVPLIVIRVHDVGWALSIPVIDFAFDPCQ